MKRIPIAVAAAVVLVSSGHLVRAQQNSRPPVDLPAGIPEWAYGFPPVVPGGPPITVPPLATTDPVDSYGAGAAPADDDGTVVRIPGSKIALPRSLFTRAFRDDGIKPVPDWYPEEHGPMPPVVRFGRQLKVMAKGEPVWDGRQGVHACGHCHYAAGVGRPDNSAAAGLPVGYFLQQMEDYKNGLRRSADPRKQNNVRMEFYAKNTSPEENRAAAEYFASLPFPAIVKVIETDTVAKAKSAGGMFRVLTGAEAGQEPIGQRIIEVAEHPERTELRDPRAGYIAYAPVGSVKKGEAVVAKLQCTVCHGPSLGGRGGMVPPIAGRSATYLVRQLFDFQVGTRRGLNSPLMKPVVDKLTSEDMLNVAAYVASRVSPEPARQSSAR